MYVCVSVRESARAEATERAQERRDRVSAREGRRREVEPYASARQQTMCKRKAHIRRICIPGGALPGLFGAACLAASARSSRAACSKASASLAPALVAVDCSA